MKLSLSKKIKLPLFSLLFFIMMVLVGYGKTMVQTFLLIAIHDLGHLLATWLFHYPVHEIIIFPFGLSMQVEELEFRSSLEEMVIAMAGLVTYLVSMPLLFWCFQNNIISKVNLLYLQDINQSILIFNALPIYPLDGGRVLHGFLHLWLPFKQAKTLTICLSIVSLAYLCIFYLTPVNLFAIVLVFLAMQLFQSWQTLPIKTRAFYLYRYGHSLQYSIKIHHKQDLFRNHRNIVKYKGKLYEETAWILWLLQHGKTHRWHLVNTRQKIQDTQNAAMQTASPLSLTTDKDQGKRQNERMFRKDTML